MKRILLATVALSLLATPMAFADSRGGPGRDVRQTERHHVYKHNGPDVVVKKNVVVKKKVVVKRWQRGHRLPAWERKVVVRDYHRHGLRKPARGQEWVRVGNDYLLIGITSGIIASLVAGR
jgi:Ni/Co efflux regulator RcnB